MRKKDTKKTKARKLTVEELERRIALSVPAGKKDMLPTPYWPGTDYGLIKRANLK
jgi:hypothetical protein